MSFKHCLPDDFVMFEWSFKYYHLPDVNDQKKVLFLINHLNCILP